MKPYENRTSPLVHRVVPTMPACALPILFPTHKTTPPLAVSLSSYFLTTCFHTLSHPTQTLERETKF
ncbi:hypothetical protein L1987_86672 [Smallanthus sonchifolius]|uniref:Uncharacterized protein n=1 Tax=Smallanthus sonchifolius TaxID=185202 RepID=A0ACB8Y0H2_9ASTR|nr:hypothetical protein L1987_86672 [Smallanthus sonchifolius]